MTPGNNLLFIVGPPNTATSSLLGMLNCHPEIFILYETYMNKSYLGSYGNMFLDRYPDARPLFGYSDNIEDTYGNFYQWLKKSGLNYRYVGDKFVSLDLHELRLLHESRAIFTIRDIRTWLCKEGIATRIYRTNIDIVPAAIEYTRFLIESFRLKECLRLKMEDFITDNDKVIQRIADFIDLDLHPKVSNWWQKIGKWSESDPKSLLKWYGESHASSNIKPEKIDAQVELTEHPVWAELLPLFDKYYENLDNSFLEEEMDNDVVALQELARFSPAPLDVCYKIMDVQRFKPKEAGSTYQKSRMGHLKSAIYHALKTIKR